MNRLPPSMPLFITSLLVLSSLVPFSGCEELENPCPGGIFPSVEVALEDPDGLALNEATLTFEVLEILEGEDAETCRSAGNDGLYICGTDQGGTFVIEASLEGYITGSIEVEVELTADACHTAITEEVTLTLEPEPEPEII